MKGMNEEGGGERQSESWEGVFGKKKQRNEKLGRREKIK